MEPKRDAPRGWKIGNGRARTPRRRGPATPEDLGPTVAALRVARGLSRKQTADRADIDSSTLYRIETGDRGASREVLERLATALEASPQERDELLATAGYRPDDPTSLLADEDLSRLYAILSDPRVSGEDRTILLDYIRLAVRHAEALGYGEAPERVGQAGDAMRQAGSRE